MTKKVLSSSTKGIDCMMVRMIYFVHDTAMLDFQAVRWLMEDHVPQDAYIRDYCATIAQNAPMTINSVKKIVAQIIVHNNPTDLDYCAQLVKLRQRGLH